MKIKVITELDSPAQFESEVNEYLMRFDDKQIVQMEFSIDSLTSYELGASNREHTCIQYSAIIATKE